MKNYYLKARFFPTVLTVIPLLIFVNNLTKLFLHPLLQQINEIMPLLTQIGLSGALIFLMVQLNRFLSKEIFQRFFFQEEIKMPTTNHLMWSNNYYTVSTKQMIYKKIEAKFSIKLLSGNEANQDELTTRKEIVLAVSQIRNLLRENKLLLQHNIEYGFFRNLLGGCLFAMLFSIGIFITGLAIKNTTLNIMACIFFFIYMIPVLFSSPIIKRYGNYYSKVLIEQFLSERNDK